MNPRDALALRMAEWTGLDLERGGRADALDRLIDQRKKVLGFESAEKYVGALSRPDHPEVVWLVNAITVGHTWFFRDREQIDAIASLLKAASPKSERLRVWVAGCSTGEEAYTVAMITESTGVPAEILATDINSESLERARLGEYSKWSARDVPRELMWMLPAIRGNRLRVDDRVRRRVHFERHNLMAPPPKPVRGSAWDMVLCRNVLIYFHRSEIASVAVRLASGVGMGGWLVLGAGEILEANPPGLSLLQVGSRYALQRARKPPPALAPQRATVPPPKAFPPAPRVEGILERALTHIESGTPSDAIALCAEALQLDPLAPHAHLVSGIAFHMNDDPTAATHALRSALLLDPDEWLASFYLALSYDRLGREEDAQREYRHVEAASRRPRRPVRLRILEAYCDEIVLLARARGGRGFAR